MDTLGTRLGVLCLTATLILTGLLTGCAEDAAEPDVRTPPARELPSSGLGGLAEDGAGGVTAP